MGLGIHVLGFRFKGGTLYVVRCIYTWNSIPPTPSSATVPRALDRFSRRDKRKEKIFRHDGEQVKIRHGDGVMEVTCLFGAGFLWGGRVHTCLFLPLSVNG